MEVKNYIGYGCIGCICINILIELIEILVEIVYEISSNFKCCRKSAIFNDYQLNPTKKRKRIVKRCESNETSIAENSSKTIKLLKK